MSSSLFISFTEDCSSFVLSIRTLPISTRTDTLFPYTTHVRSQGAPAAYAATASTNGMGQPNGASIPVTPAPRASSTILLSVTSRSKRAPTRGGPRSEEHTSELQSLMRISYAVFRLKKKTTTYQRKPTADNTTNKSHTDRN